MQMEGQQSLFDGDRAVVLSLRCPVCRRLVRGKNVEHSMRLQREHCQPAESS